MSKQLLPLCSIQRPVTRDGWAGPEARLNIPFFGFWYANGKQVTTSNTLATIGQYDGYTLNGRVKPDVYQKDCCGSCTGGGL